MSRFTILLGGELAATPRLLGQVAGTRVIAADGGMRHGTVLGLPVELWVGDFDSSDADLHARHAAVPRQRHPTDKDQTDGELAVAAAIERGARDLILAGGFGGEADHSLAHLAMALRLAQEGLGVLVTSGREEAYPLLGGELSLDLPTGSRLSLVAFSDLEGLHIGGVRWPLRDARVPLGSTWTLSNEVHGPVAIRLGRGSAIVLARPG